MEDVDTISVAVSGIDINKVEPLDSRRIVAFINNFLCTSVTFLNQFSTKCETKLEEMQQKIYRIESKLKILECKLASIPATPGAPASVPTVGGQSLVEPTNPNSITSGSNGIQNVSQVNQNTQPIAQATESPPSGSDTTPIFTTATTNMTASASRDVDNESISESEEGQKATSSASSEAGGGDRDGRESKISLKDDPTYSKYFKMAAVGVPIPAIKLKMMSEGVDPSVLDR